LISIILVNYNVSKFLFNCIDSIIKSEHIPSFEIIVIDNNSMENVDIDKKLKEYNANISFYQFNENKGFAKAVNYASDKSKGDTILLLNPDTILKTDSISILHNYLDKNDDVGIVGSKVLYPNGDYQLSSKRHFPLLRLGIFKFLNLDKIFPKSKYFGQYNYTYEDFNQTIEVDAVSGCCMMFKKNLLTKIGNFDERFFLYFEDTDFCYRVKKYFKVIYNPNSTIIHSKRESFKNSNIHVNYEFFKSLYVFYSKYFKEYHNFYVVKLFVKFILKILVVLLSILNKLYKS